MTNTKIAGRCLCGAIRYSAVGEPVAVAICHCDDCQRQSGAPFSLNVVVAEEALSVEGDLTVFETIGTETGKPRERRFCGTCGSPVITIVEEMLGMAVIKAGTLDDRSWLQPGLELWTDRRHEWLSIDGERMELPTGPPA